MPALVVITQKEIVAHQALSQAACALGVEGKRDTAFLVNHGAAALESGQCSIKQLAMFLTCCGCRLYAPFFATFRAAVFRALEAQDAAALLRCMLECGKMLPEAYDNACLTSAQVSAVDAILQQEYEARTAFLEHLLRYSDVMHIKKNASYTTICDACSLECYVRAKDPVKGAMTAACRTPTTVRVPDLEPSTGLVEVYRFDYAKLVQLLADGDANPNTGLPFAREQELRALYATQICMARA